MIFIMNTAIILMFSISFVLKGKDGAEKNRKPYGLFQRKGKTLFDDVKEIIDYSKGVADLPKENVSNMF